MDWFGGEERTDAARYETEQNNGAGYDNGPQYDAESDAGPQYNAGPRYDGGGPFRADWPRPDREPPRRARLSKLMRVCGWLHLWLGLDILAVVGYVILREKRRLMNAVVRRLTLPLQRLLGKISYLVPFSVMELLAALTVLLAAAYFLWSAWRVLKAKGQRFIRAYAAVLGALCVFLLVEACFCYLWGIQFWADGFQEKSGLYAEPVSVETLERVTRRFAAELSAAADTVPRDENGVFAVPVRSILADAPGVYDGAETLYPFLRFDDKGVKPMVFSRIMSIMDFTGFYCAYTGEANVNVDAPACLLPATCAHEMAHQRGFASEQECNFLAVLASVTSGNPAYVYSGYLMGYIYLGNALYSADPAAYAAIRDTLPETVLADLRAHNAYWDQFRGNVVEKVSTRVYDGILKGYGDERGTKSYGAMVDLLAAYYGRDE